MTAAMTAAMTESRAPSAAGTGRAGTVQPADSVQEIRDWLESADRSGPADRMSLSMRAAFAALAVTLCASCSIFGSLLARALLP